MKKSIVFVMLLGFLALNVQAYLLKEDTMKTYKFNLKIEPSEAGLKAELFLPNTVGSVKYISEKKQYSFKIYPDEQPIVAINFNNPIFFDTEFKLNKQQDNITLKPVQKLDKNFKEIITLFTDALNSTFAYLDTKDPKEFKNVSLKLSKIFIYIDEFKKVDLKNKYILKQINDLIKENLTIPNEKVDVSIKKTIDIIVKICNIYQDISNKNSKFTAKNKQQLTETSIKMWWDVFDIVKSFKE